MGLLSHQVHQDQPKSSAVYVRHRPETTLLYQIVQEYWPEFQAELASHGRHPRFRRARAPTSSKARLAQMDRVLASEARCHWFESSTAHHFKLSHRLCAYAFHARYTTCIGRRRWDPRFQPAIGPWTLHRIRFHIGPGFALCIIPARLLA